MNDNDLLTLADRETDRLTAENNHGAAIIMRALAARLRVLVIGPTPPPTLLNEPAAAVDGRPADCRNRRRDEGRIYPRSGCQVCKTGGKTGCPYEMPGVAPS